MPLQILCPHCFQSLVLPYTEAGLKVKCPNCQGPISLTAAHTEAKPRRVEPKRSAPADLWFFKAEDGSDYGPVKKDTLDQWYAEGRVSADCQILHLGDEQWHWAGDLFPDLEIGQGEIAEGVPVKRYDISDLLPPIVTGPAVPQGMYGLPGGQTSMPAIGPSALASGSAADVPRMTRRLSESVDPNLTGSSLYLETLDKIEHRRGGQHPLVVATAVLNFIFGTYSMILGILSFIMAVYNSTGPTALMEGDLSFWTPLLPLALVGYAAFVLQTAIGLLNYQAWTIMATYMQAAISMTVSIIIIFIPVWLAFPPLLIFAISGLVYGVLASIAVSIPWVIDDFD
jgi:phage FluMu protein Com